MLEIRHHPPQMGRINKTDHQSFVLKPSTVHDGGVGVFALHDIAKDTYLELFTDTFEEEIRDEEEVPKELQGYCLNQKSGKILCPKRFNQMDIGNYLNHSESPNAKYVKGKGYFALRNIRAGEEILGNYRELGEPEGRRGDHY